MSSWQDLGSKQVSHSLFILQHKRNKYQNITSCQTYTLVGSFIVYMIFRMKIPDVPIILQTASDDLRITVDR